MAPSMRPAGPQKRYTAYMRTPSGLMPVAVPGGTTRAFVNKTDRRRKAGRAKARPSAQHSPSVDGEDEGGFFDEEEATQEEDGGRCIGFGRAFEVGVGVGIGVGVGVGLGLVPASRAPSPLAPASASLSPPLPPSPQPPSSFSPDSPRSGWL
ncbi:hypothetical protein T492DRAFT_1037180 [Pavlovales sp. CCMP2436]|nr:hypothetical protein T492DRAFT_1037180 [Pavlovales sp. CCMP2436]